MLEWGEQRPWSPADLIGVPRELRSNGERRSDGALYFGMPKSFSEVRDDEGYRLCDSSAECECKGTMNILGFANFFRKKMKKSEKNLFNYVKNEDELHELQNCT